MAQAATQQKFKWHIDFTNAEGKAEHVDLNIDAQIEKLMQEGITCSARADDIWSNNHESIINEFFNEDECTPTTGESVADLRTRLFESPNYQVMYGVLQQMHPKYAKYEGQKIIADREGKTEAGEVAQAAANTFIESVRSTAGHQARVIVRYYAKKFGASVESGDREGQSARSLIEEVIGDFNKRLETPRGLLKLEAEKKLLRGAVDALRKVLVQTLVDGKASMPTSTLDLSTPAAAPSVGKLQRASGPVKTLTKKEVSAYEEKVNA